MGAAIDSADFKMTFYGILNAQGDFWTPLAFDCETAARRHIQNFWQDKPRRDAFLGGCSIVPVRIQLTEIASCDEQPKAEDAQRLSPEGVPAR
jgi:hypothetical protein